MTKKTYAIYLRSPHWQRLRTKKHRFVKRRVGESRCAVCGTTEHLDVHHLRYRPDLTKITTKDLRVLCRECHDIAHALIARGVPLMTPGVSLRERFDRLRDHVQRERRKRGKTFVRRWREANKGYLMS